MSQHARRLLPGILVVVALCTARPSAEIIEQILVKVNGEILTKTDLEQRQVQAIRAKGIQPADDEAMKKAIEDVTPEIMANAIDEMLLTSKARSWATSSPTRSSTASSAISARRTSSTPKRPSRRR